jgi:hypothetical protein
MSTKLRVEDIGFIDRAPYKWAYEEPVSAPQKEVFEAISADPSTWTWFPGITSGGYEGAGPHGVGSRRKVSMAGAVYRETILAWDPPSRWVYRVDETTVPLAHALVEDWTIIDRGDHTVVRWTFAIDPRRLFRVSLPVAPAAMGKLFAKAMRNLSTSLGETRAHGAP